MIWVAPRAMPIRCFLVFCPQTCVFICLRHIFEMLCSRNLDFMYVLCDTSNKVWLESFDDLLVVVARSVVSLPFRDWVSYDKWFIPLYPVLGYMYLANGCWYSSFFLMWNCRTSYIMEPISSFYIVNFFHLYANSATLIIVSFLEIVHFSDSWCMVH